MKTKPKIVVIGEYSRLGYVTFLWRNGVCVDELCHEGNCYGDSQTVLLPGSRGVVPLRKLRQWAMNDVANECQERKAINGGVTRVPEYDL